MPISILHHGAVQGVTGSCHELLVDDLGLLIDCGLFQGDEAHDSASSSQLAINFPVEHIKALVVTHVHIDHVGRIPYLLAAGFKGPIICSEPSALLLPEVLADALKVGVTRDKQLIDQVLGLIRSRLVALPYQQWHQVWGDAATGVQVRLQRAGHILGSAYVECAATSAGLTERIVFSGDLGAPDAPLLTAPESPEFCDRLVLESTYGDKNHEDRSHRRYRLKAVLEHALADGGTVLIPAFSIGRTQELLYEIESLIDEFSQQEVVEGLPWHRLDIVVDSPLAANFTSLYRQLADYWDEEARARVDGGRHPLAFEQLTLIDNHQEHLAAVDYLARSGRPCIVLAASGMCAGGRIVNYLKAMLDDERNDVVFVGYQAAGTPGRDILRYGPRGGWVNLDGEKIPIRAKVHELGGYSAHAGQIDLVRFVTGIVSPVREVRIVHGDKQAKLALRERLQPLLPTGEVIIA